LWNCWLIFNVDLCVSAALDAVKGNVSLPWTVQHASSGSGPSATGQPESPPETVSQDINSSDASVEPSPPGPELDAAPTVKSDKPAKDVAAEAAALEWDADEEWDAGEQRPKADPELPAPNTRVLSSANFTKALQDITPSSSESLGTLGELRKWNDEFGDGRREKRRQMWGKGNFGFINKDDKTGELKIGAEGSPRFSNSNTDSRTDK
jgi:hypothetical protein